ncbi:hypothetical protein EVG20_g9700 [Dentipellis fragilis]|uniref:Uncharacterized protein n=1 Tax=Dentipellis fragilis TaxID=205917 RepID=A0A4Y9XW14_9AGAM|nr:hypothetical protein EVG20_g9700 [Dentipellis fragilis]
MRPRQSVPCPRSPLSHLGHASRICPAFSLRMSYRAAARLAAKTDLATRKLPLTSLSIQFTDTIDVTRLRAWPWPLPSLQHLRICAEHTDQPSAQPSASSARKARASDASSSTCALHPMHGRKRLAAWHGHRRRDYVLCAVQLGRDVHRAQEPGVQVVRRPNRSTQAEWAALLHVGEGLGWLTVMLRMVWERPTAPRGLRVRRLDLFCWPELEINLALDVLLDLFSYLPDLEIPCVSPFTFLRAAQYRVRTRDFTTDEVENFVRALSHPAHVHSLRKCIVNSPKTAISQCNALLKECTQLSCLLAVYHGGPRRTARPSAAASDLPLCRLQSATHSRNEGMEVFLRIQGARLRTVQLDMRLYCSRSRLDSCLRLFAEHCPNLVHIVFICDSGGPVLPSTPTSFPPTVTHLGIYADEDAVYPELGLCEYLREMHAFFECGATVPGSGSGSVPGIIRRLNVSVEDEWAYLREWDTELAQFASMPVPSNCRLEDAEGRDLMLLLRN